VVDDLVDQYIPARSYADQWDTEGLYAAVIEKLNIDVPVIAWAEEEGVDDEALRERIAQAADEAMASKAAQFGPETMRNIEKQVLLQTIDGKWRDHLLTLDHLKSVVGFRGYAQRDPLNEYKSEAFALFEGLLNALREEVSQKLGQVRPITPEEQEAMMQELAAQRQAAAVAAAPQPAQADAAPEGAPAPGFDENDQATWGNPGRNDACPCGSGKKFKHCHGKL